MNYKQYAKIRIKRLTARIDQCLLALDKDRDMFGRPLSDDGRKYAKRRMSLDIQARRRWVDKLHETSAGGRD